MNPTPKLIFDVHVKKASGKNFSNTQGLRIYIYLFTLPEKTVLKLMRNMSQNEGLGVPLWHSGLRTWCSHCYGMGLHPGLGTSTCSGAGKKKKKKKRNTD